MVDSKALPDSDVVPTPSKSSVVALVHAVVTLGIVSGVCTIGILVVVENKQEALLYIAALNGVLVPIIVGLLAFLNRQTHDTVNSRMDKYEKIVERLARAQGNREGRAEQAAEHGLPPLGSPP